MDERAAKILAEAFETIERVERGQQERAAERAEREEKLLYEKGGMPPNSKSRRASRIDDGGLIYKTTVQPEPEPKVAPMDVQATQQWNAWADARIRTAVLRGVEEFASLMDGEVGQMEQRFNTELKRLAAEIEALREDVRAANAKNITPLRPRDVA
jgi:hypothetical protein